MKLKIPPIKKFAKKLPRIAATHTVYSFGVLGLMVVGGTGLIFYLFVLSLAQDPPQIGNLETEFKQELLQRVIDERKARTAEFQAARNKPFENIFVPRSSLPSQEATQPFETLEGSKVQELTEE